MQAKMLKPISTSKLITNFFLNDNVEGVKTKISFSYITAGESLNWQNHSVRQFEKKKTPKALKYLNTPCFSYSTQKLIL